MSKSKADPAERGRAVVVTTEHRGVFFGYLATDDSPEKVVLADGRNCVYWSSDVRGFLGLAATGPTRSCKVGPKAPQLTVMKVTAIADCSEEAAKAWEEGPWQS
jgi:hypothetical protein